MKFSPSTAGTAANVSPGDIYVNFDTGNLAKELGATHDQLKIAANRAAVRVRNWLLTQLRREMATEVGAPQRAVKGRFKRGKGSMSKQSGYATLWIGTNEISAEKIGVPKQTRKGVRTGKHFFDRAFVANVRWGEKVWRRKGKERHPLIKMTIPVDPAMVDVVGKYEGEAARKFEAQFEHELKYEMGWFD